MTIRKPYHQQIFLHLLCSLTQVTMSSNPFFAYLIHFQTNSSLQVGIFLSKEEPNMFQELIIPTWMKVLGSLLYFLSFPFFLVILSFFCYESQGLAGNFRTIINQLVSWIYLIVRYKETYFPS